MKREAEREEEGNTQGKGEERMMRIQTAVRSTPGEVPCCCCLFSCLKRCSKVKVGVN